MLFLSVATSEFLVLGLGILGVDDLNFGWWLILLSDVDVTVHLMCSFQNI